MSSGLSLLVKQNKRNKKTTTSDDAPRTSEVHAQAFSPSEYMQTHPIANPQNNPSSSLANDVYPCMPPSSSQTSNPYTSLSPSGLPCFEIPHLIEISQDAVSINIPTLQKHFPNFNFFSFMQHLTQMPFSSKITIPCTINPSITLETDSPHLLKYHLEHFFLFAFLHKR